MRLGMMRIPCVNLQKAEQFYTDKLGFKKTFGSLAEGYIGYSLENIDMMIELEEKGEFESGRFLGFSLLVKDIYSAYNTFLEKGIEFTGPPEKQPWGGVMTHIIDDSGNSFSLVQEVENV